MNFYRLQSHTVLHSFGEDIGCVPIGGMSLAARQQKNIESLGGHLIDVPHQQVIEDKQPYFVFEENLFFTSEFLQKAIQLSESSKNNVQFSLAKNTFNERYLLPTRKDTEEQHIFHLFYHQASANTEIITIPQEIFEFHTQMPSQIIRSGIYHMDQCEVFAGHIISPFHLLFINLAVNLARTVRIQKKIPSFLRQRFGQSGGKWFYRGLKRMNTIGKNCKIHPTALLEGAVIGDNVTIGAHTIVRLSTIANDCYISDNVSVINSVLGRKTCIANSNYINSCVTYDEVFLIHGPYQISIFGENSACFAVINCDIRLDQQNIKIPTSEGILDSQQEFLGIAYGHRSKTGGGNIIAAGRIVPNDLHITPPENILLSFDKP